MSPHEEAVEYAAQRIWEVRMGHHYPFVPWHKVHPDLKSVYREMATAAIVACKIVEAKYERN